jgi:hypothetical protein
MRQTKTTGKHPLHPQSPGWCPGCASAEPLARDATRKGDGNPPNSPLKTLIPKMYRREPRSCRRLRWIKRPDGHVLRAKDQIERPGVGCLDDALQGAYLRMAHAAVSIVGVSFRHKTSIVHPDEYGQTGQIRSADGVDARLSPAPRHGVGWARWSPRRSSVRPYWRGSSKKGSRRPRQRHPTRSRFRRRARPRRGSAGRWTAALASRPKQAHRWSSTNRIHSVYVFSAA